MTTIKLPTAQAGAATENCLYVSNLVGRHLAAAGWQRLTAPDRSDGPAQSRNSADASVVLDKARAGDIEGALGRIRVGEQDDQRRTLRRRLLTFLAIMGPGIIVMVGDNDAGGVATYSQAGQNYGYSLLWVLLLLVPVLIVNQEMVVRLGAVTGVGHARLINERFGRFWLVQGGVASDAILLIIAIVGTTVAPWQLFFQQSNVIDKRITPRFINHERADTLLGSVVVAVGAGAMMIAGAYAARGTGLAGHFTDALGVASALGNKDTVLGTLFAIVLLDASIIGAGAVTLSTSYAIGDFFGLKHSLHRSFRDAKGFYTMFTVVVFLGAGIVLIPGAPLGVVTEVVQALAGLLLPSASLFLLLLCNDREVLGPWVNRAWLNVVATVFVATLLMLSGTLMATTIFTHLDGARVAMWLSIALATGLAATGITLRANRKRHGPAGAPTPRIRRELRNQWRMPPLALLKPVTWSLALKIAMLVMRGYLVIAALLLLIKAIQLGTG